MAITGFSYLPEDLTSEILARLPVKSLLRFKCVQKSWYALIKKPIFVAKHLQYAYSKNHDDDNTRIALRRWDHGSVTRPVIALLSNKIVEICHDLVMPFFDEDGDMYYDKRLCGSCNGIICVFNYHREGFFPLNGRTHGSRIALWNPATREFKELLDSDLSLPGDVVIFAEIGFGFDSKSNDYKVVRMRYLRSKVFEGEVLLNGPIVVEVYNLSTESWRRIDDANVPKNLQPVDGFSTYLNGFYYWWARDDNGLFVLSFDFANEVFEKIPPPKVENLEHICYITVFTLNESIALGIGKWGDFKFAEEIVVWMLNRDGERRTWNKQLNLPFQSSAVLGFLRSGEALISDACLVRYDPSSQESKDQIFYESVWGYHEIRIAIYVESLVSLKGAYELDHSKTFKLDDRFSWLESAMEEQNLE